MRYMQGYFVKITFLRLKRLILAAKSASYCHFLAALWCSEVAKIVLKLSFRGMGIGVRQVRRPEGVRRNALRAQRPKSPHFEESAQA